MTILIVGAGTAGLTLARSLAQQGRKFLVFDAKSKAMRSNDRGLGLWGRSQAVLSTLGLSELLGFRIPAAAYRSRHGDWLSASSDTAANHTRVSTLLESDLLAALEDGLPAGSVRRGAELVHVQATTDRVALTFADGSRVEGSAVVGADGVRSSVRRLLTFGGSGSSAVDTGYVAHSGLVLAGSGAPANLGGSVHRATALDGTGGGEGDLAAALMRNSAPVCGSEEDGGGGSGSGGGRGWASGANESTTRGASANSGTYFSTPPTAASVGAHAFETLSQGRRFAMVPLANGGAFWFATRQASEGSPGEGTSGTALRLLREAYDGWHQPIPKVLHFAACAAAEAAMGGPSSSSLGVPRFERLFMAPKLSTWHSRRAVLVGDAAHALPINLAQGAAMGIEGAYLLGEALGRLEYRSGGGGEAGFDEGYVCETELSAAFSEYQALHEPRVRQCRTLTAFTELLAKPASPLAEGVRDAMRFVPQPLNGFIFDSALQLSLGDQPRSTRAKWPLAITCNA